MNRSSVQMPVPVFSSGVRLAAKLAPTDRERGVGACAGPQPGPVPRRRRRQLHVGRVAGEHPGHMRARGRAGRPTGCGSRCSRRRSPGSARGRPDPRREVLESDEMGQRERGVRETRRSRWAASAFQRRRAREPRRRQPRSVGRDGGSWRVSCLGEAVDPAGLTGGDASSGAASRGRLRRGRLPGAYREKEGVRAAYGSAYRARRSRS